jgi:pimeloyl-ACP methyl ester carboxylesterase
LYVINFIYKFRSIIIDPNLTKLGEFMQKSKLEMISFSLLIILGFCIFVAPSVACPWKKPKEEDDWTLIHDGRGVKLYPDLREYVWVTERPPFGSYDKIGLHRLVKEGIRPEGVVFLLPGTWSNGEQLTSNPPDDPWTHDEDHSFAFFLANRNFDVYAIDYRTHFVPQYLNPADLSFMIDWGWDQWIGDIKKAVELTKEVSGVKKIFIAGDSFGGSAASNYASMYWEEDLKGILLRDGGTAAKYPTLVHNDYNLPAKIAATEVEGNWSTEVGGTPGSIFIMQYADMYPDVPPYYPGTTTLLQPNKSSLTGLPFANIGEWAAYMMYMSWGPGVVTNIYGGYGDPRVMVHVDATFDRYWPTRLSLESNAISNWDKCPYVSFDFDDHYQEIDVPLLGFTSGNFGLVYWGPFEHCIANPDFTGYYLMGYGHLDVYSGEYSKEQVSQPTYEWLMNRRMLEGYGSIKLGHCCRWRWNWEEVTIFINENVIDFKIGDSRFTWTITQHFVHKRFETYIGKNDMGSIVISIDFRGLSSAVGCKVYFIGFKM